MLLLAAACTDDVPPEEVPSCALEAPAPGALATDGTRVRDAWGRVVALRGVNAGGRSKFAPYMPFDYGEGEFEPELDAYLDRASSWGVTVLRVPFNWAAWEPIEGQRDEDWLERYTALVDGAWARGIWSIVDFHQDVYGEFYCGDGFPAWTVVDPPEAHHDCADWFTGYLSDDEVSAAFDQFWSDGTGVQSKYREMWGALAHHFADHPGVVGYEVFNEPGWGSAGRTEWAATTLTTFYGAMESVIHEADPDALVLFDATGLDGVTAETALGKPAGTNLVFAPHYYDPAVIAGAGEVSADVPAELADWAAYGEEWGVPVLIGEYGVDPDLPEAVDYMESHYGAFDEHGLHATWWQYSVSSEPWNFEDLDLVDGAGVERAALVDILSRPVPRAVAGENVGVGYEGGTLFLSFEANSAGVTEVTLPQRPGDSWPGADSANIRGSGFCYDRRPDRLLLRATADGPLEVEIGR